MTIWYALLAQSAPTTQSAPGGFPHSLIMIILAVVVFWWVMSRGRTKERRKFEQMLGSLKRSDRVQTIGGIIGTVVDVRDDEVVLKIDEASNVKMRFSRQAIKGVVQDIAEPK